MAISYNGLWKLLIDKNLKKTDLIEAVVRWQRWDVAKKYRYVC